MKQLTLLLIALSGAVYSQKLQEIIQGEWLCTGIVDSNGKPVKGKYGEPTKYLKFNFNGNYLAITQSPFDKALAWPVRFTNENSVELPPLFSEELPERIYLVKDLNENHLTLRTKSEKGDSITYHFLNQQDFSRIKEVVYNGILIVEHFRLSKANKNSIRKIYEYKIPNDSSLFCLSPIFEDPYLGTFGQLFSVNFKLPKDFNLDKITDEMVLDFDVSEDGASNFQIKRSLSNELDKEAIRVMEKLRKNWKPVIANGKPIKTKSRFHLYFYLTISELKLPFFQRK